MFNRIKKYMPTVILTVGLLVVCLLLSLELRIPDRPFRYESLLFCEQIRETAGVVLAECIAAAILFKLHLKKEKFGDHDSGQKL